MCSSWLRVLAAERYGDRDTTLVPNGVDLDRFSSPPRNKRAVPTVGLVYSQAWIKGCDVAVEAYELARRTVKDLRLLSFGNAPPGAVVLPTGTDFVLRPDQDVIPRIYASADAWLWPSRREGFGLPVLEAMACRTPVIAAPAGAAAELLSHGGGILLPASDPVMMANAIVSIVSLQDPAWCGISGQARASAEAHSWDASADLFEAALETAVGQGRTRKSSTFPVLEKCDSRGGSQP